MQLWAIMMDHDQTTSPNILVKAGPSHFSDETLKIFQILLLENGFNWWGEGGDPWVGPVSGYNLVPGPACNYSQVLMWLLHTFSHSEIQFHPNPTKSIHPEIPYLLHNISPHSGSDWARIVSLRRSDFSPTIRRRRRNLRGAHTESLLGRTLTQGIRKIVVGY